MPEFSVDDDMQAVSKVSFRIGRTGMVSASMREFGICKINSYRKQLDAMV